jgi:drug/metabolite transporter (DMT)-like permease
MWGSSYLFIKIGVETLPPLSVAALRIAIGFAILAVAVAITRTSLPRDRRTLAHLAVLGVVNVAMPFWLIGWAEQRIDSGLAGMLQASSPIFTLVIAGTVLHDERITAARLTGVLVGFAGIVVLSGRNLGELGSGAGLDRLLGDLAIVASSLCYAIGNVYARRNLRQARPLVLATGQVGAGLVVLLALALVVDGGVVMPAVPGAAVSVLWLGAVGTGFAYMVFFRMLTTWGATRASLVAYLMPVVAVALGVVILAETIDVSFLAGAALTLAGIWVANRRP